MKKLVFANIIIGLALLLMPAAAGAVSIGFSPSAQAVDVGDPVFVDVVISDLNGEIVSAYDLDITYDASILTATDVTFGSFLGDEFFFEVFNDFDLSGSGVVDMAQLSLLSDADLAAMQPASFVLATIEFQAIADGTSALDFVAPLDIKGLQASIIDVDPASGSVTVGAPIPEPSAALIFGLGAFIVGAATRVRR